MAWNFDNNAPVSFQIANIIRLDIVSGKYKASEQFPTVRQLAYDASVNPNTVQKALSILENEGLLVTKSTNGRFVTDNVELIEKALSKMQNEFIDKIILEGSKLGITREKFIEYIKERNDII